MSWQDGALRRINYLPTRHCVAAPTQPAPAYAVGGGHATAGGMVHALPTAVQTGTPLPSLRSGRYRDQNRLV